TFDAAGFEGQSVREVLAGGEAKVANSVRLSAGEGSITGSVTSGDLPLGGVRVTPLAGDEEFTTATPTSGAVGVFDLGQLPTPGTFVLTFERDGYGSETLAVALGPGEARTGLSVEHSGGT